MILGFITELSNFFFTILQYLRNNVNQEITSSVVLGLILVSIFLLHKKTGNMLSNRVEKHSSYIFFLNDLVFPFLYILITNIAGISLKGKFTLILFNSIAYFYIGFFIIRNLLKLLNIRNLLWSVFSYALLLLSIASLSLLNLNDSFFKNTQIHDVFFLVFKVSLILLTYIFLFKAIKSIINLIPEVLYLSRQILENLIPFFLMIYFIVSLLWVLKVIQFSSSFFIGIVLSLIAFVVYTFLRAYFRTYISPKIEKQENLYPGLLESIRLLLTLILIFVLYKIFKPFFNLDVLINSLSNIYVIKTDIVGISLVSVISAIFGFVILFLFLSILKHMAYFYYIRKNKESEGGSIRAMVSNLGLPLIFLISLSLLGLTWRALLPVAGALGIGIGFGLQTIMNNYISGFILLFSKKLKLGDVVEVQGNAGKAIGNKLGTIYGRVKSIDILSTVVGTTDGIEIVIPNSQFISGQIVNYSLSDSYIRVRIPFGVSYSSDPDSVKDILLNVAKKNPLILDNPEPAVWFSEMSESALVFNLLGWVNLRMMWKIDPLVSEIYFKGLYELQKAGVEIPFPQQDVWFKNKLKIELKREPVERFEEEFKSGNALNIELGKEPDSSD
jgi:small-conductance mechanosensitive channel